MAKKIPAPPNDKFVNCYRCKNCIKETESWEQPDIFWYDCRAKPAVANLTSFPFKNTMCEHYEGKDYDRNRTAQLPGILFR